MAALLVIILATIPLLITPNLHLFFDVTPKAALLLAGTSIALLFAVRERIDLRWLTVHRFGFLLCVLLAAAAISASVSTIFSADRPLSLSGTNWRRFGLPVHLALSCFTLVTAAWLAGRPDRVRLLVRTSAACGLCAGIYGILQYFGWDPWLPQAAYKAGEDAWTIVRPPSTLGHANYFATWMLFPVFAGAGLWLAGSTRFWRILGVAAVVAGSLAVVLSGSRSAVFGLAAGGMLLTGWCRWKPSRATALALLLVAAGSIAFYLSPPGEMLRRRMHWIKEDPLGGARLWLWKDSLAMAARRLPTGYGPETFSLAFPRFQSVELSRAYPAFYHESPHNIFLDALSQQGIPGLAVLMGLAGLGLAAGFQAGRGGILGKALCASLVAFLVSEQFNALIVPGALYLYLTIAILVASCVPAPKGDGASRAGVWWTGAAALCFALFFLFSGIRMWAADTMLRRTERLISRGELRAAAAEFKKANAWGATADLWYSRSMASAAQKASDPGAWKHAFDAAVRATSTAEDRHNAWYNLAVFRAQENDFARTEMSLREAIRCAPNWFKPHWMLARFLQAAGRLEEAKKEAELAVYLDAGKDL